MNDFTLGKVTSYSRNSEMLESMEGFYVKFDSVSGYGKINNTQVAIYLKNGITLNTIFPRDWAEQATAFRQS